MAKDAVGNETKIRVEMGGELFTVDGLQVEQLNYLEVYTFDKWSDKYLPKFRENE